MGEGLLREKIRKQNLDSIIGTDSCGTGGWHVGEAPDARAQACMREHGIDISDLRGRKFSPQDFSTFDWILCMDQTNYENIQALIENPEHQKKVVKMLKFHPDSTLENVPDPYFGLENGFEKVYAMLDVACDRFLKTVLDARGGAS